MAPKTNAPPNSRGKKTNVRQKRPGRNPNEHRRRGGTTGYEEIWANFIDSVESEILAAETLPEDVRRSPFYSTPNIVKRAVYRFALENKRKLKSQPLEDTIDKSRVAHAKGKILRGLKKNIKKEPFFWLLTGLSLDCPAANIRKPDVTRFSQHLNYANRHKVPPEFLVGFLLQSGSLTDIYQRAQDPDRREHWYLFKKNV